MGYIPIMVRPDSPQIRDAAQLLIFQLVNQYGVGGTVGVLTQALTASLISCVGMGEDCADLNLVNVLGLIDRIREIVVAETAVAAATAAAPKAS